MNKELKKITKYLNENFPEWRNSKFYSIKHCFSKGFKYILIWGVHLVYKLNIHIVYIWLNRFVSDVLKKEVKW